jgi:hypothetical protein
MLTACTLEWAGQMDAEAVPVASSAVYLRVRRHGAGHRITDDTLSIGFRTVVIEDVAEVPDLLTLTDQALIGARRLGVILAGHRLDADLTRMNTMSAVPLRGAAEVLSAWANRAVKQRGVAVMVDTASEASATGAELTMVLEPVPVRLPDCPACAAGIARTALARCLAVGLTGAVHAGRYLWEGTFRVLDAVDRAGWDVLSVGTDRADCRAHAPGEPSTDTAVVLLASAGS